MTRSDVPDGLPTSVRRFPLPGSLPPPPGMLGDVVGVAAYAEPLPEIPDDAVPFATLASTGAVGGLFRRWMDRRADADWGMSGPRVMLLITLLEGSRTMGELARTLNVTRRAITRLIDGLEEDGHVTRTRDLSDRRKFHISCTPETRARLVEVMEEHRHQVAGLTESIPLADLRTTLRTLHTLGAKLNQEFAPTGEDGADAISEE